MKLATLDDGGRDGTLLVVSRDGRRALRAQDIAPTLQAALDQWAALSGRLEERFAALQSGEGHGGHEPFDVDVRKLRAPLPRAYHFVDGSAYLDHIELVRRARGAEMPESFRSDPLVYQGSSDRFLGPTEDIVHKDAAWGIDFEAVIGVITDDVPYHTSTEDAAEHIKLLVLLNDVSLCMLIPSELRKSFGFYVSKPPSAMSPFALTPDELGESWREGKVWRPLTVHWNGDWFGSPEAGPQMQFSFPRLLEHVAQTRPLGAGTVLGSGTISNADRSKGSCCIAEKRTIEKIETGAFITPFMQFGDTVRIEMRGEDGESLFGAIEQRVVAWAR